MAAEALRSAQAAAAEGGLASALWLQAIGWAGQGLFAARVLIQWYASERAGRPVAPVIFWYLSAGGAVLMTAYCVMRGEVVLVPGFVITLMIYLRNLWIANRKSTVPGVAPVYLVILGLGLGIGPYAFGLLGHHGRETASAPWLAVAIVGQALWIGRFLLQWRHAEQHGKSEFPPAFWWLTIAGGSLNTLYSLHRVDLPLIFGFVMSWVAPVRNLMLHRNHQKSLEPDRDRRTKPT